MYKKSFFSITQFINQKKEALIFSTISGQLIKLSVNALTKLENDAIAELDGEILGQLLAAQIVVKQEEEERNKVIHYLKGQQQLSDHLHFDISPSSNCQMGCDYCGQMHVKQNMSLELEAEVLIRIKRKVFLLQPKVIDITWFGAEPLLNLGAIKWISEELILFAKDNYLQCRSNIITNGLLLFKDTYTLLLECGISDIQITLDGDKHTHNRSRFLKTGKGTFDKIYNNVKKVCLSDCYDQHKCPISIRVNIDKRNYADIYELMDLLQQDGLHQQINFYPAFVHTWENDVSSIELARANYANLETEMYTELIERGFHSSQYLLPQPITKTCMATSLQDELYSADGEVFNCTEMLLTKNASKNSLGNLMNGQELNANRPFADWFDVIQDDNTIPCYDCSFLPSCGGHCPKHWIENEGIACPSFKFNMKDRMQLYYYNQIKSHDTNII